MLNGWALRKIRKFVKNSNRPAGKQEKFRAKFDLKFVLTLLAPINRTCLRDQLRLFGKIEQLVLRKDVRPSSEEYRQGAGGQLKCGRGTKRLCSIYLTD